MVIIATVVCPTKANGNGDENIQTQLDHEQAFVYFIAATAAA